MRKSLFQFICLFILVIFIHQANSQTIDFVDYTKYGSPPVAAFYSVTNVTGEVHAERLGYTPSFSFNGQTVLEIKTFSSASGQEVETGAAYIELSDEQIMLHGSTFTEKTLGTVTLPFAPPIVFPRNAELGSKVQGSVNAAVRLGPIPVNVTITVTYEFEALENVVLDIGTFADALRLRTVRAVSLSGIPLVSQDRTEWHHPTASMIKFVDNDFDLTGVLTTLDPPLPPQTHVEHWSIY